MEKYNKYKQCGTILNVKLSKNEIRKDMSGGRFERVTLEEIKKSQNKG